jgi:predicted ArsR family transcriptional regulator
VDQTRQPAPASFDERVRRIAALGDRVRRRLYRFVAGEPEPVSREQAAAAVGVPWHVAKFHLDKLEQDGLLEVEFRRPPGRAGPGAGRPTKLYRRGDEEVAVALPERRYELAGAIMARAISQASQTGAPIRDALREAAAAVGHSLGEEARGRAGEDADRATLLAAAREVIDERGYESRLDGGRVVLANCPFHAIACDYPDLVCGMNLDLLDGMLESLAAPNVEASLDPSPRRCCVTMGPA